jgi:hypothetical protein
MTDRQNTLVCIFEMSSPRISAYHIHERIFESLRLEGPLYDSNRRTEARHVYIKFQNLDKLQAILRETGGKKEYRNENGEISRVQIEMAGMGIRTVRIVNLPPEVPDSTIKNILSCYGEVKEIKEERWLKTYRYKIPNGIRLATLNLRKHIPSYLHMANNRVLLSYEGQPVTCYGCGATGHLYQDCPTRLNTTQRPKPQEAATWSTVVKQGNRNNGGIDGATSHTALWNERMDNEGDDVTGHREETAEESRWKDTPNMDNNMEPDEEQSWKQDVGQGQQLGPVERDGKEQEAQTEEDQQEQDQTPIVKEPMLSTHHQDWNADQEDEPGTEGEAVSLITR